MQNLPKIPDFSCLFVRIQSISIKALGRPVHCAFLKKSQKWESHLTFVAKLFILLIVYQNACVFLYFSFIKAQTKREQKAALPRAMLNFKVAEFANLIT